MFRMNKKGFTFNQLFKLLELAFLLIIILSFVFLTRHTVQKSTDTSSAEAYSYLHSMLYSKNGILYHDSDIDRQYPGIIDVSRFNDIYLDSSMLLNLSENVELPAAKLALLDQSGMVREAYWHKKWYDRLYPKAGGRGVGSPRQLYQDLYVLKRTAGGRLEPAYLSIELIVPRR
ncbi:hypothetical protein GF371_00430 [Candidatus Woesearchaeota archaeon]|nr:hypothetical protein [Candidatus Woesearchaeota archaeon]